ncbi:KRAB-A domain-containing protein 2 [Caerostris darwini]|uniref:KRAB-A domain-containing protein 2 n=1 Tax=Caerostris darwini TaxID=1538125 RepID=A0AAV4QZ82_9ARAC|nr:KRAB-A domain-containing protein 2 [Caerostris darwini]
MEIVTKKYLILKRKSECDLVVKIVPTETFYLIFRETHRSTDYGGRYKMMYSLKSKYLIPTSVVLEFLKLCTVCQSKLNFQVKESLSCPIVSSDFNHRGQGDLVDLPSTRDRNYKWLLNYQDHASKFNFLRPLTPKSFAEVAMELSQIFMEVGSLHILQRGNDPEFTAAVIQELTRLWPTYKIVNGRPRHPASQGSVERSNQDVEAMLRAWLIDNDTKNWAIEDLYLILNQQDHDTILTTEHLPAASLENNNRASTSKDLPASELIDYNTSISNDLSIAKSPNNNTSMSHNLSAADILTKKILNLEDLLEIESIYLSTTPTS